VCEDCYEATGSTDPQFSQSRSLPSNQTGEPAVDLGSKNFNWSLPLVSLPGRAGLDLGLTLSYNSLVWVKQGNSYQFNADGSYPSPGFQLGFPRIQKPFNNGGAYMMVTPSGGRVALAWKGSTTYEATDGSYAQLKLLSGGWARVTTTDGTQYTFEPTSNGEKRCREVRDRNGNFISVYYDWAGRVGSAVDTLGRQVNFVYNGNGQLYRLTQDRSGSGHTDVLAQFEYSDFYMQPLFVNAAGSFVWPNGPHDTYVSMLSRVWLPDGETYHFEYTLYGQVWKITRQAPDGHVLGYQWYDQPSSPQTAHITQTECPRFTVRRDYAEYGVMQQNAEVSTFYATDVAGTVTQVTYPDGTVYKEFFDSGATEAWRKGLTIGSEVWSGGVPRKWTNISWTQTAGAGNPRVTQTVVEDAEGSRRKTTIEYNQGYSLPTHVREYGKVGGQEVELRLTTTTYNLDAAYLDRRIIGLPSEQSVTDSQTGRVVSKETYFYDWGDPHFSAQAPSVQYSDPALLVGRGNLAAVYHYNCPETGPATCQDAGAGRRHVGRPRRPVLAGLPEGRVGQRDAQVGARGRPRPVHRHLH
jgi:YD repeat-containing protein